MKTTIRKRIILAYLSLGTLLTAVLFVLNNVGRGEGNWAVQLDRQLSLLILNAHFVLWFGVFIVLSSIAGWLWGKRKNNLSAVKTFQITTVFGIIYLLAIFFTFVEF